MFENYQHRSTAIFLSQLKEYTLVITALQETRRKGKDIMDMKSHFFTVVERTREFGVAFVV
jgi:hypothetical protein